MLRFFRSSGKMVIVIILLTGILTWLHVLSNQPIDASAKYGAMLFCALNRWLVDSPGWYFWCGIFLFLLLAMQLVSVNNRFHLIEKSPLLPVLCFVLLVGGIPEIHLFNPAIIAVILLMISFRAIAKSFESDRLSYSYFFAPVFISAATFFYQYMYVYMLVVWVAIALYRPWYWREWVFSVLGYALPLFFAFSWFFLVDDDYTQLGAFLKDTFSLKQITTTISLPTTVFMAFYFMIAFFSLLRLLQIFGSKKIIFRTRYTILILIVGITVGLMIIVPGTLPLVWYLLAFPMSFIIANFLATIRSLRWGTVLLLLLFIAVIAVHVYFLQLG